MRDRHSGPRDEGLIRKGDGEQENGSRRQQDCTRKHSRGAHGGRSNCFKIARRRLINLQMLTRCSDPLAASRCGSLGPGRRFRRGAKPTPPFEAGVLFVCLFILAVPPGSLAAPGIEVGSTQGPSCLAFLPVMPSAKRVEGSAR